MDQEAFEQLSQEEQERIFHQTPFRERGDLLLHSHNPTRLTQSLTQEELYLLTREMDLEERGEILRYASLPQLFFISDIDCWKKDRLHSKSFVRWLETLLEADEARLLAWLVEMDYETVVSGFKGLVRVLKPEWEYPSDELLGDQPYFTLDERYFISVKEENLETVRRAIEILFENTRGRYAAILEGILGEMDYELEEEAFQKRSIRLAERGFPDPETAHHIYRPLSKEEFERFPRKSLGEPRGKAPSYLILWSHERFFLDEVLLLFRDQPPEVREGLEEELAWLSNKIIASEGVDFASEERVRRGIERARRFVNIGLEDLSGRDLSRAREIVTQRWLEVIFRWGMTQLLGLRESAREILNHYWKGEQKVFFFFLEDPYRPIFRGLFEQVPEYFDPEIRDDPDRLRDFKELREVEKTRNALLQIRRIHEILDRTSPSLFDRLNLEFREQESGGLLFPLLGSLFASFVLNGKVSTLPLSEREVTRFLQKGFEDSPSGRILKRDLKDQFLDPLLSNADRELLRPLWALVFQRLEEELGALDPSKAVDHRFVTSLYYEKNRKSAQSF